jgi:hypothetical protein
MKTDPRVFEYCHEPPPFAPGRSPFHIKGQFYIQQMRALRRLEEQGLGSLASVLPGDLKGFCGEPFLASSWYDSLPFPRLAMIEAELRRKDVRELTFEQAQSAARHGVKSVYKLLIPLVLPKTVALRTLGARMVRAIAQFYDFGPAAVIPPSDSHILTIERNEVPLCMIEWFAINARGYAESALQIAGVSDIVSEHQYMPTGESHGAPVGRVVITIRRTV